MSWNGVADTAVTIMPVSPRSSTSKTVVSGGKTKLVGKESLYGSSRAEASARQMLVSAGHSSSLFSAAASPLPRRRSSPQDTNPDSPTTRTATPTRPLT